MDDQQHQRNSTPENVPSREQRAPNGNGGSGGSGDGSNSDRRVPESDFDERALLRFQDDGGVWRD